MRKIVLHMTVSLDGFFEGPDHDIGWHLVDDELHTYVNEHLAPMSAFLEGRVSYELMEGFWPTADQDPDISPPMKEFAGIWRGMPKIVFSRTLEHVGPNAEVRHEVDPDEIRALKEEPGGDMAVGGADLADTFRRHDLIDEYRLMIFPVVLGSGKRLFRDGIASLPLRLVHTAAFTSGVVVHAYEPDRSAR